MVRFKLNTELLNWLCLIVKSCHPWLNFWKARLNFVQYLTILLRLMTTVSSISHVSPSSRGLFLTKAIATNFSADFNTSSCSTTISAAISRLERRCHCFFGCFQSSIFSLKKIHSVYICCCFGEKITIVLYCGSCSSSSPGCCLGSTLSSVLHDCVFTMLYLICNTPR
jgi:hypothetical protein